MTHESALHQIAREKAWRDSQESKKSFGQPEWYRQPAELVNCETPWGTVAEFIKEDGDHMLVRLYSGCGSYVQPLAVRIPRKWSVSVS